MDMSLDMDPKDFWAAEISLSRIDPLGMLLPYCREGDELLLHSGSTVV